LVLFLAIACALPCQVADQARRGLPDPIAADVGSAAVGITQTQTHPERRSMGDNDFRPRKISLAEVRGKGSGLPSRAILHGPEGSGKSSFGACAPKPIFVMTRGETGLETLIDAGRVPETPHFPELEQWPELLCAVQSLLDEEHAYRTLVLDTLNGCERLCHEYVCQRDFNGQWGRDGFTAFMTGYEVALVEWRTFLETLDRLRDRRHMSILALAHTRISTFKNPEGTDFDRYTVDVHSKTWGLTHKWTDLVLFLNFISHVETRRNDTKGKARGGSRRVLWTTRTAAFDAKNRHGLPDQIDAGSSAEEAWHNFVAALKAARNPSQVAAAEGQPANNLPPNW
jgi:hypothetical protein